MTLSPFMALLARRAPTRVIDRVPSGSPEVVILSLAGDLSQTRAIEAVFALAKRGVSMLRAKRAVEAVIDGQNTVPDVPVVEDIPLLASELRDGGFGLSVVAGKPIDVKRVRERLDLTQEQFAMRFGLDVDAVRNWEHGRREPDRAARSYLAVIDRKPERVQEGLAVPVATE
jgi:DNA-binding XRE family transcriptional regulator